MWVSIFLNITRSYTVTLARIVDFFFSRFIGEEFSVAIFTADLYQIYRVHCHWQGVTLTTPFELPMLCQCNLSHQFYIIAILFRTRSILSNNFVYEIAICAPHFPCRHRLAALQRLPIVASRVVAVVRYILYTAIIC